MWRLMWCMLALAAAIREPSAETNLAGPRPSMWRDHRHGRVEEQKHDATVDTGFVQGVRLVRHDRNNATKVFVEEGYVLFSYVFLIYFKNNIVDYQPKL